MAGHQRTDESRVLTAADAEFERRRRVFNADIDVSPAAFIECRDVSDIQRAVRRCRETGVALSVKGAGHNLSGSALLDGGVVLDLAPMKRLELEPGGRRVTVSGPVLIGELVRRLRGGDRFLPVGNTDGVSVTGLTLVGGLPNQARAFGLTCCHLESATIVDARGQVRVLDARDETGLFWALKGAGDQFGVVAELVFELVPVPPHVLFGFLFFPLTRARELLTKYFRLCTRARFSDAMIYGAFMLDCVGVGDEFMGEVGVALRRDTGRSDAVIVPFAHYGGDLGAAQAEYLALRESLGEPYFEFMTVDSHWELHELLRDKQTARCGCEARTRFVGQDVDAESLAEALASSYERSPIDNFVIDCFSLGGALRRTPADATSFPHLAATSGVSFLGRWGLEEPRRAAHRRFLQACDRAIRPHVFGAYSGIPNPSVTDPREYFGANYERLAALKRAHDPSGLFRKDVPGYGLLPPRDR